MKGDGQEMDVLPENGKDCTEEEPCRRRMASMEGGDVVCYDLIDKSIFIPSFLCPYSLYSAPLPITE